MCQGRFPAKGFSLIEIMVAIVIAAVILGYAAHSYRDVADKVKVEEASRVAYEIRQAVELKLATKRKLPASKPEKIYPNMAYVEKVETIRGGGEDSYEIKVYFKKEAFPDSPKQKVFTLLGDRVGNRLKWKNCGKNCIRDVDGTSSGQPGTPTTPTTPESTTKPEEGLVLSLIHISEPTRRA